MVSCVAGLIFDMDGTLVLSEHLHRESWIEPLAQHGIEIDDVIYSQHFAGKPGLHIIRDYCGITGDDAHVLYAEVHDAYWEMAQGRLHPLTGLIPFLKAHSSLPKVVCTSAQRASALRMLEVLGITDCFEAVVTASDVTYGKPDPEPFIMAADLIQVEPAECIAFEDSASGLISARAAGMFCIGVGNGQVDYPNLADGWIEDFSDPLLPVVMAGAGLKPAE